MYSPNNCVPRKKLNRPHRGDESVLRDDINGRVALSQFGIQSGRFKLLQYGICLRGRDLTVQSAYDVEGTVLVVTTAVHETEIAEDPTERIDRAGNGKDAGLDDKRGRLIETGLGGGAEL